jgi:putative Mn2+ efflux pump MntP
MHCGGILPSTGGEDLMQIFDRVDPLALERRERHLLLLALGILFIFAVGIALLVYPAVFSIPIALTVTSPRAIFFGLCTMTALAVGYFVDRQFLINQLRKKNTEE